MSTNKQTTERELDGITYWIVKKPLLYYKVSVKADNGNGRRMFTQPISMNCDEFNIRIDKVDGGENVIACVPAAPGSIEVFVEWDNVTSLPYNEESLGTQVVGADIPDWDELALVYIKDMIECMGD